MLFILTWDLKFYETYAKKPHNSYMWHLHLKNELKIHKYDILNCKGSVKKTTGQWTDRCVKGKKKFGIYLPFW